MLAMRSRILGTAPRMQIPLFGPNSERPVAPPLDPAAPDEEEVETARVEPEPPEEPIDEPTPEPPIEEPPAEEPPPIEDPPTEEPPPMEEPPAEDPPVVVAPEGAEPPPPAAPPADDGGDPPDPPGTVSLARAARERYLNYALSVITARALPDVRDGLKPVQRRILYAMYANLRLLPTARFRKSAAVVGAVMASYHPHGDQSIYDAMVRLAQDFSLRGPLVEGHGNFGSLDGDPPAAMRYTEARLRGLALEMVSEIDRDTVPFRPNYDGTTQEPVVLPARIPQLLVNGSTGIAVGMATNIPPHNLGEVVRAAVALLDDPELTTPGLLDFIEGPDFPMGGEILASKDELRSIYESGRGPVRLRATWTEEKRGRRRYVVVDSIPWGKNKASVIEKIGELVRDGEVPQITDVRDESTDDIRIVLELKRRAQAEVAMAYLFRHTDLQINVHVNTTVLLPTENPEVGAPAQVGLRTLLRQFLDFRLEVVGKRLEHDLEKLRRRIHVLLGFAILFDALDEAIAIIRGSEGKKDAAEKLMARFPLDALQTDAILELKLYRLAKLEILVIREELAVKRAQAEEIEAILADRDAPWGTGALWAVVRAELLQVAAEHADPRRTRVVGPEAELAFDPDAYIIDEDTWVIVTRKGWMKRQKGFSELDAIRVKDGDAVGWALKVSTRSTLTFFSDNGRAYVLRATDVPATTGYGDPIQRRFSLADGAALVGVVSNDERLAPPYEHFLTVEVEDDEPDDESDDEEESLDDEEESAAEAVEDDSDDDEPAEDEDGDETTESADEDEDEISLRTVRESVGPVAVAITKAGKGLLFPLSNHAEPSTKNGRKYVSLSGKADGVVGVRVLDDREARVFLATHAGRVLVFLARTLKYLRGTGKGVNAIRIDKKDRVIDFALGAGARDSLVVETSRGREVNVSERKYGLVTRGGKGLEVIKRGTLRTLDPEPVVLAPGEEDDDEDDDELEAIADELEDGLEEAEAADGSDDEGGEADGEPA